MTEELSCRNSSEEQVLDKNFWNKRWENEDTGWDIGYTSPAIENYMLQFPNKEARILIPGCGNAHEALFLVKNGFHNINILDISPVAVDVLQEKFKDTPQVKVICEDFFQHNGIYDLMIEQTFFCAIPPISRSEYVKKAAELLSEKGKILGVMFNKTFEKKGPPFGGSVGDYQILFKKYFEIKTMEKCYNSIPARQGTEIFINLHKK
jgi:SAM-dependent methyltransferase